jgi:hypothetical protein
MKDVQRQAVGCKVNLRELELIQQHQLTGVQFSRILCETLGLFGGSGVTVFPVR